MSERYRRGIDIAEQLAADKIEHFVKSGVAEVAPDFARMVIEFAFGDLYARDALDLRSRELIAIAVLAASGERRHKQDGNRRDPDADSAVRGLSYGAECSSRVP